MNTNSNNNVNAQMIALGRAISNSYGAGTSTSNSTNKDNYINGIFQGTNHLPYFFDGRSVPRHTLKSANNRTFPLRNYSVKILIH